VVGAKAPDRFARSGAILKKSGRGDLEIDRPRDNLISVTFAMAATKFTEVSQVIKIISGEVEPP